MKLHSPRYSPRERVQGGDFPAGWTYHVDHEGDLHPDGRRLTKMEIEERYELPEGCTLGGGFLIVNCRVTDGPAFTPHLVTCRRRLKRSELKLKRKVT